ncbi:MAG TPA: hypothetical protein P5092_21720, partial [Ruminococcus sp.]|nr:hypothetical protein [Ruminococcus sp.]
FWTEVWETWRRVTNPKGKPKTEKQIRKWLADPYTDSAEYKLWGNGISLPIPYFVLSGIAWVAQRDTQKRTHNAPVLKASEKDEPASVQCR